jgi:two-component system, chemotaxis family, chemotaxis protein CheY
MKILVVDDSITMRRLLRSLLTRLGHQQPVEAEDGFQALAKLHNGDFQLLITDLQMPGMNGLELLRAVRADSRLRDLPILLVTSDAPREAVLEAAREGICGVLLKPFTAAGLREKLETAGVVAPAEAEAEAWSGVVPGGLASATLLEQRYRSQLLSAAPELHDRRSQRLSGSNR